MIPTPPSRLALYALPALPLAALGIPVHVHMPTLYADDLGLGLAATGAALLAARLIDVVADPLVGLFCDRGGRLRRRLWVGIGTPVLAWAGWRLFLPPEGADALFLLLWSSVFYLGLTLVLVPYQAWGADLSSDYAERSRIAAWREGFALLGMLAALAGPALLAMARAETLAAFYPPAVLALLAAILAVLVLVPEYPPAPRTVRGPVAWAVPLMRNRPFRRLVAAQALNAVANALPATLFLMFVGDGLGAPDRAGVLLLAYFLSAVAGVPVWLALARRMGKHRAWTLSLVLTAVAFLPVPFLGPGDWLFFAIVCVLTGMGLAADLTLPSSILADVVDEHTALGGGDRAGLYFALWSLTGKLALAAAVGLGFPLLDLAGFAPGMPNDTGALAALALLYAGLPILLKLAAALILRRFPLDERRQQELRRRIALLPEPAP